MNYAIPAVVAAALLILTGCAVAEKPAGGDNLKGAPAFHGPYASELTDAWRESQSDFVRDVIKDEEISDSEWAELGTRMTECLSSKGLEFGGFGDDGSYTVGPSAMRSEDKEAALNECEKTSGELWVHPLRLSMSTNPDNVPIEEVMTQCLVRNDAVPADYTEEQFLRDNPTRSFPFKEGGEQIFWACTDDSSYDAK